ncbi:hypothetical protein CPT_Marzo_162 [Stenotrophomonas phage Marzo]|nr:hypothetical protein CPT_Marzo_162 [Stenotrophomonas phage Marzo]
MNITQKNVLIIDIDLGDSSHAIPIDAYWETTPQVLEDMLDTSIKIYWNWLRDYYYPKVEELIMNRELDGGAAWAEIRDLHEEQLAVKINGVMYKGLLKELTQDIPGFGYRNDPRQFQKTCYNVLTLQEWIDCSLP